MEQISLIVTHGCLANIVMLNIRGGFSVLFFSDGSTLLLFYTSQLKLSGPKIL